jgi:hypothetical protein
MKMLSGRSWAYLIGGAAGALVLSVAGGAWSADDYGNPTTPPAQATPPPGPHEATPPAPQQVTPPAPQQEATPPAGAADQGQPSAGSKQPVESASLTTESSNTVTAIDHGARRVTLKDPAGEKSVVSVPKDVKAFDTLKVGDRIDIDYYQSVALSIAPPGTKPGESERMAGMAGGGAEAMGKSLTVTAKVVNVDTEANEVTFKGPKGMNKTVKVQDPDLQKRLPDLKAGDSVQLTFTEATAADIRPAAAAK